MTQVLKKILVTGGAGFIGSHLCKKLLSNGDYVICLDNLFTGTKNNIIELIDYPNFKFIEHDIIYEFYDNVDQIYNLACPASPPHYQHDPIKTTKTSVLGIINMMELAKKCNARILQASTSEVYGNPTCHPQSETYWGNVNPIGLRSCYDEGKRCAESLMMDYYRQYGVDIRIVRIFNTYGPNMDINDGRVVSNFIVQALKDSDLTVYGDGNQTRSFCYIDDLIEGLIKMMNGKVTGPVNLGNDCECTIFDFAKMIIELTGSNSKIVYKNLPSDDPVKRKPDLTLANNELNWKPEIDFKTGLKKTIKYFEDVLK